MWILITPFKCCNRLIAGDAAKNVAVAVGISYTEYYLNSSHQPMSAYTATSGTLSVVCGRLSFTLGLKASLSCPTIYKCPRKTV